MAHARLPVLERVACIKLSKLVKRNLGPRLEEQYAVIQQGTEISEMAIIASFNPHA